MSDDDELLTIEQVAETLKIGRTLIYELITSGDLPSVTIRRSSSTGSSSRYRHIDACRPATRSFDEAAAARSRSYSTRRGDPHGQRLTRVR